MINQESNNFIDRFNKFQKLAVDAISSDFSEKSNGRFLLVIPTGGGKTFTAVKSVNELFEKGVLNEVNDRVIWTAHRTELLSQAKDTFNKFEENFIDKKSFKANVDFKMIGSIDSSILSNPQTKLVVIDEAHHGAANSYLPIFERPNLGVLGLTATPTRHDGKPLEFERESFSIGFPDLVELGVVLRPEVRTVKGGTYNFDFSDDDALENLNDPQRNLNIINALLEKNEDYDKVIIYVGTKKHVESLYQDLIKSRLKDKYESISYVTGDKNSRNQSRADYFNQEKKYRRSIIVNVDILTEGYDDPSINTVVMARPTASKLIYMQSMGRAIRHDPENDLKKAYILEVVDSLPNIRYRIDNRWLYSDISDALEPAVIDREFSSAEDFKKVLEEIYAQYNVPEAQRLIPDFNEHYRYTLLLFKAYSGNNNYFHHPILIDNENRSKVSNVFNFISERMETYRKKQINSESVFRMVKYDDIIGLETINARSRVFEAMENASSEQEVFESGRPWITFVTFQLCRNEDDLPENILKFIDDLINKDEILRQLKTGAYPAKSYLIKYPLPLAYFVGKIVPDSEFEAINKVVDNIYEIKNEFGKTDHRQETENLLKYSVLPVEPVYAQSLVQIVREEIKYYIQLN